MTAVIRFGPDARARSVSAAVKAAQAVKGVRVELEEVESGGTRVWAVVLAPGATPYHTVADLLEKLHSAGVEGSTLKQQR